MFSGLGEARAAAEEALAELHEREAAAKLFALDGSLWSDDPEQAAEIARWIGWLPAVEEMRAQADELQAWGREHGVEGGGFERVVLCGMGGSSLAPLVFARSFGRPQLQVLDTTDPDAVRSVPVEGSLFVISSKSGSTIEPSVMEEYFWEQTGRDGSRFVAVTDPGSKLGQIARDKGFRRVFENRPDIGGRYSALSYFGLVPAVLAGIPIGPLLEGAAEMVRRSRPEAYPENPGLELGAVIGGLARTGRDKLTIAASPAIASIGLWLEQLIAESTGKHGTGVVPLADESLGDPSSYGDDRLFVHLRLADGDDPQAAGIEALAAAGHPVLTLDVAGVDGLGAEMVRWELATAYTGALLGINPFDQPNVQAAKDLAVASLKAYEERGRLDEAEPGSLDDALAAARRGESYVAIQAFVTPTEDNERLLQGVRERIRESLGVATSMGFGPRYLHSTGQLHKGGPKSGVFLQVVADSDSEVEIPGRPFGFRTLIDAQSSGDAGALREHGLPVARVPLSRVETAVSGALQRLTTTRG